MPVIRQHRPAFFEGWENEVVNFNTVEELLAIPFVKNFSDQPNFDKYSISKSDMGDMLMAEYDGGLIWWVVGHLKEAEDLQIPVWNDHRASALKSLNEIADGEGKIYDSWVNVMAMLWALDGDKSPAAKMVFEKLLNFHGDIELRSMCDGPHRCPGDQMLREHAERVLEKWDVDTDKTE